jgi:hypothetical protein
MKNRNLIPYRVIVAAKSGDPDAMNEILAHYNNVIEYHSRRTMYDEFGNPHTVIDPEIKDRIQAKIIDKIIYDFDPQRLPEGETLEDC